MMNYKMWVTIANPDDLSKQVSYELLAQFSYDERNYGNGHYVYISGENFTSLLIDLRYDTTFHKAAKYKWLMNWAYEYWSGENGAYKVIDFRIKEVEDDD